MCIYATINYGVVVWLQVCVSQRTSNLEYGLHVNNEAGTRELIKCLHHLRKLSN